MSELLTPTEIDYWANAIRLGGDFSGSRVNDLVRLLEERANARLRERIVLLQAEVDVLNGTACAEEQARGKGPCGSCRTCRNERIEKLEAECEFVKAQKESLQRTAEFAVSLAEQFERAVASREPVSGMQVTPTGDFISAAQLPSVLKRMKWWAREIRKADAARAALGEVKRGSV